MCLNQLSLLLSQATNPKDTAAIIIEPVLGEGGYVPAPKEFLEGLRAVCDKHGILLIIDEVHLLNDERGAVIETIVARTLRQVSQDPAILGHRLSEE